MRSIRRWPQNGQIYDATIDHGPVDISHLGSKSGPRKADTLPNATPPNRKNLDGYTAYAEQRDDTVTKRLIINPLTAPNRHGS